MSCELLGDRNYTSLTRLPQGFMPCWCSVKAHWIDLVSARVIHTIKHFFSWFCRREFKVPFSLIMFFLCCLTSDRVKAGQQRWALSWRGFLLGAFIYPTLLTPCSLWSRGLHTHSLEEETRAQKWSDSPKVTEISDRIRVQTLGLCIPKPAMASVVGTSI